MPALVKHPCSSGIVEAMNKKIKANTVKRFYWVQGKSMLNLAQVPDNDPRAIIADIVADDANVGSSGMLLLDPLPGGVKQTVA